MNINLSIIKIFSVLSFINISALNASLIIYIDENKSVKNYSSSILTEDEFEKCLQENVFLKSKTQKKIFLTERELKTINLVTKENEEKKVHILEDNIKRYQQIANTPNSSSENEKILKSLQEFSVTYKMKPNRQIEDFKGDILVIGGGRKETGMTNINELNKSILAISTGKFHPSTGERMNAEMKENLMKEIQQEIEERTNKYYTVNYSQDVIPDLIGSATDLGLLDFLPDNRFEKVFYENVDTWVFLNPTTLQIAATVCKPRGYNQDKDRIS